MVDSILRGLIPTFQPIFALNIFNITINELKFLIDKQCIDLEPKCSVETEFNHYLVISLPGVSI